jgi:hypothetical protein
MKLSSNSFFNKIILIIIFGGLAIGIVVFIGWWQQYKATKTFNQNVGLTTGQITIGRSTENYEISAVYPVETRDADSAMAQFVNESVRTSEKNWSQPDAVFPGMKNTLDISYDVMKSQELNTVSYIFRVYEFTGGAHGNTALRVFTFDNQGGEIVPTGILRDGFQTSPDFIKSVVRPRLVAALEIQDDLDSQLMMDQGLCLSADSTDCIGSIINNIIPTDSGLDIVFDTYQVAPYVVGQPTITIPWAELATYLTPEFAERLK